MASKPKAPGASAGDVMRALKEKHREDVFVRECKDGPTQNTAGHLRMDAWVMKRSWAHPLAIGYEVKVSRSDYMRDVKWPGYLPLCNELYFVTPKGLLQVDELPSEAGLIEMLQGGRLITRKKAPYRDVILPDSLWRYILMCRTDVKDEFVHVSRLEECRRYVEAKEERKTLGWFVTRRIQDTVTAVQRENDRLTKAHQTYDDVRALLERLGLDPEHPGGLWGVERKIKAAQALLPEGFETNVRALARAATDMARAIEALEGEK